MVIERPITGFTAWEGGEGRKPLSRSALLTICGVAALHLGGAAYLYTVRTKAPEIKLPIDRPIDTTFVRLPQDKPKVDPVKTVPKVVRVHPPIDPVIDPVQPVIPFVPQPKGPDIVSDKPPVFVDQAVKIGPVTPPQPAEKVIRNPTWLARPTAAQLEGFYPPRALEDGISGEAVLDCQVTAVGQLTHCSISGETPRGKGFGDGALKASRIFRMSPRTEDGQPVEGGTVHIPIHFQTTG